MLIKSIIELYTRQINEPLQEVPSSADNSNPLLHLHVLVVVLATLAGIQVCSQPPLLRVQSSIESTINIFNSQ